MPLFGRGEKVEQDEQWAIHASSEPVGWELFARGALRKGDWKIVHMDKKHGGAGVGDEGWELFNIREGDDLHFPKRAPTCADLRNL